MDSPEVVGHPGGQALPGDEHQRVRSVEQSTSDRAIRRAFVGQDNSFQRRASREGAVLQAGDIVLDGDLPDDRILRKHAGGKADHRQIADIGRERQAFSGTTFVRQSSQTESITILLIQEAGGVAVVA